MDESHPKEVREQVARVMRGALAVAGGREALAGRLGVEPYKVAEWINGISDAPSDLVQLAVALIVENLPPQKSSPRNPIKG